jgi:hypothetical protein
MTAINIRALMSKGRAELQRRHAELEETKRGILRVGNSGSVGDGKVIGKCHRITLARFLGAQAPIDDNRFLMFDAGITNEDSWADVLGAASYEGKILREEEIPVAEKVEGTEIMLTGRPDIVLADESGKPKLLLELKLVSSYYTALGVLIGKTDSPAAPKTDHLCQAANYCRLLGVPGKICYASRVDWHVQHWDKKRMPADHESLEYNEKGEAKKIMPFLSIFDIRFGPGQVLQYKREDETEWTNTRITTAGVRDYFRYVAELAEKKQLGPRVSDETATGEKSYKACSYCSFQTSCDKYESNFDNWLDSIRLVAQGQAS